MRKPAKAARAAMAVALVLFASAAARAGEAQEGYLLVRQWCTSCHIVAPNQDGSDAAPPFESIANDPNFTEDGIRAWLSDPHPPMPNLNLNRVEIDRIVAYLQSLRN